MAVKGVYGGQRWRSAWSCKFRQIEASNWGNATPQSIGGSNAPEYLVWVAIYRKRRNCPHVTTNLDKVNCLWNHRSHQHDCAWWESRWRPFTGISTNAFSGPKKRPCHQCVAVRGDRRRSLQVELTLCIAHLMVKGSQWLVPIPYLKIGLVVRFLVQIFLMHSFSKNITLI